MAQTEPDDISGKSVIQQEQEQQQSVQTFSDPLTNHIVDYAKANTERATPDDISGASVIQPVGDDSAPPQIEGEEDLLKYLEEQRDANRRLTRDEVEKLRRKQRTEEIVSGISDAVMSLSNLYFTSQYAPSMYDHTKGMSEATKARWDKAWKEREAENDRYLNFALKGHGIKAQQADTQYKHYRDKVQDELKEREMSRKEDWDAWRMECGRLDNEIKSKQLEIAQATGEAKVRAQNELAEMYKARAELYNRTPKMGGSQSGKSGGKSPKVVGTLYDENGNPITYYNAADYRAAVEEMHPATGQPAYTEVGSGFNTKEKPKNTSQKAADINAANRGKNGTQNKGNKKYSNTSNINWY